MDGMVAILADQAFTMTAVSRPFQEPHNTRDGDVYSTAAYSVCGVQHVVVVGTLIPERPAIQTRSRSPSLARRFGEFEDRSFAPFRVQASTCSISIAADACAF